MSKENIKNLSVSDSWNFSDQVSYKNDAGFWLNKEVVEYISAKNNEPDWMLQMRLQALELFNKLPMPSYWPYLGNLDLQNICYYAKVDTVENNSSWDELPENIKNTFDKLWIPEAEKKYLAWVWAQYDSDTVYHSLKDELIELWVIFEDSNVALQKYPDLFKKYFTKCISLADHKFAALHYAVWSWWTFLYVPEWVKIDEPLQSYFRMNKRWGWQFEHTIIILEKDSKAHYIEWCSAPKYDKDSLHAGWVEIFVWENASMRYSSVENWSLDTYNLNTKRAIVEKDWIMEWVWWNMWSNTTMLYPCSVLKWDNSKSSHLWLAFANAWQNQDTWAKVIHIWKNTTSKIVSKSISKWWWISTYRWLVDVKTTAINSVSSIECDWLLLDWDSVSNAVPKVRVANSNSIIAHEASAWKISQKELFYLESRWIKEEEAKAMIVNWFLSPITNELPLEYASEMNVLISMEF